MAESSELKRRELPELRYLDDESRTGPPDLPWEWAYEEGIGSLEQDMDMVILALQELRNENDELRRRLEDIERR